MKVIRSIALLLTAVALFVYSVPVHASETDSRIEASARQSYVFKTYLQGDDIRIRSREGAVTLTGMVLEESHKSLAEDTVASLPGVTSVANRLEVNGESPDKNLDAWLSAKVKSTLMFHRSVSGAATEVNVKHGIVTLRGNASSQAQKDLTTEYARDIEGVRDVINEMKVVNSANDPQTLGEKIDDASITAQVKMTLLYHRSTSALNTKVETNSGVVTLDGRVKNRAESDLAAKLAKDVYGVKGVNNRMTIE